VAGTLNSCTGSPSSSPPAAGDTATAGSESNASHSLEQPEPLATHALDFDELYRQHFDFVCRSLRLLGVAHDALEDAAQDVFGVALRRLDEFEGKSSAKTWIFAIVQRVAANHRRTERRKRSPLDALSDMTAARGPSPEAEAQAAQSAALIQTFSDRLDEGSRALLVLGVIEGLPMRDVAVALGIAAPTAYARLRTLRRTLAQFLEQQEQQHG
jgi:RNA polymerase sigma-70 factor, ECF subfamily